VIGYLSLNRLRKENFGRSSLATWGILDPGERIFRIFLILILSADEELVVGVPLVSLYKSSLNSMWAWAKEVIAPYNSSRFAAVALDGLLPKG
ncbi:hypothetical protein HAX54_040629, partial [Datura stramonium]|nr:hypothetical protein [Datura stramonium]